MVVVAVVMMVTMAIVVAVGVVGKDVDDGADVLTMTIVIALARIERAQPQEPDLLYEWC